VSPFAEYAVMPVAGNVGQWIGAAIPAAAAPADYASQFSIMSCGEKTRVSYEQ
jgi:hypothetical protein